MALYLPAPEGDKSPGVASGGLKGQYLRKASDLDYDTDWEDVVAGEGGGSSATNLSYDAATRTVASDTGADATLPLVTDSEAGLVPATGGGTTNFLRADGTFAAPPSGTDINGQTEVQSALDDELIIYDTSTSTNKKALVRDIGCQGMGGWGTPQNKLVGFNKGPFTNASIKPNTDRIYYVLVLAPEKVTYNTVECYIRLSGSSGGQVARMGLYANQNGAPSTLIADYGTVAIDSGGIKQISINQALDPGWYWYAFTCDADTTTVARQSDTLPITFITGATNTAQSVYLYYEDLSGVVSSGLPSTAATIGSGLENVNGGSNFPVMNFVNV